MYRIYQPITGEPGGNRTHDPKIKSLVLYRLSYGLTWAAINAMTGRGSSFRRGPFRNQAASAATDIFWILSGFDTVPPPPLPRLI